MNVLIINAIVYTSETEKIRRVESIKDSMIYDLCLAFADLGHRVTLYAAEPYRPLKEEEYPFEVQWGDCRLQKIFKPHRLPYMPGLNRYLRQHKNEFDLVISSEVFSLNTLMAARQMNEKLLVWHELAKHNALMKRIPSRIWYNVIARVFFGKTLVVARSEQAKKFVSKYCRIISDEVIDHGVNLDKFLPSRQKDDYFVVCSQLIARKRIDGILRKFKEYIDETAKATKLIIIGDGDERAKLERQSIELDLQDKVVFMGKLRHAELLQLLARAKALLVNTEKDNSMISIVESIAVGTPVVTTEVPLNAAYIKKYKLGIAAEWDQADMMEIDKNNEFYVDNCLKYREKLSTKEKAKQFIRIYLQKKNKLVT